MSIQFVDTSRLNTKPKEADARALPAESKRRDAFELVEFGQIPASLATQDLVSQEIRAGLREVEICGAVDFAKPRHAAAALRLIRDLTSCRVSVRWRLEPRGVPIEKLFALTPPETLPDADALDAWRMGFRFGLLYWRSGPGFVIVRDARHAAINHFTLDEPEYRDAVQRGHIGIGLANADAAALSAMEVEGLVFRIGDAVVFLPYRMRHWPIPFNGI